MTENYNLKTVHRLFSQERYKEAASILQYLRKKFPEFDIYREKLEYCSEFLQNQTKDRAPQRRDRTTIKINQSHPSQHSRILEDLEKTSNQVSNTRRSNHYSTQINSPPPKPNLRRQRKRSAGVATTIERINSFQEALESIANQVDFITIYLNGHTETPRYINGIPNITTVFSEDFDDIGDAGKFFGMTDLDEGYYFSFDDDIKYPKNYADQLIAKVEKYRCPVGVHGTILRKSNPHYYSQTGRSILHFKDKLDRDTRVDVLGTGTLCFDVKQTPLKLSFDYRNMADLWVAREFSRNSVPLMCTSRDFNWLEPIENDSESIWSKNNTAKTIQSKLVQQISTELCSTIKPPMTNMPRVFIGVKTYNRLDYLVKCIESILWTLEDGYEYLLAIADDGSTDGTSKYLKQIALPLDLEIIHNERRFASGQFNELVKLAHERGADFIFILDDDVVFKQEGWVSGYYDAAKSSGYDHLCHYNLPHHAQLADKKGMPVKPLEMRATDHLLSAYVTVENCMGALMTLTPRVIETIGYADETNFFGRGLWHVDYSARACRAGFNESSRFFDLRGSNDFLVLQNTIVGEYKPSIPWESDQFKRATSAHEKDRRKAIVGVRDRVHSSATPSFIHKSETLRSKITVNEFFDRVFVINLDRRPDRLKQISNRLDRLGIEFERFSGYDGNSKEIKNEYENYCSKIMEFPESKITHSISYHQDRHSQSEQARYLQAASRKPAIRSAGAWAYLLGYHDILSNALEKEYRSVLILDDDCRFHKDFLNIFSNATHEIPNKWRTLHLGTMQFNRDRTETYSNHLYLPHGFIVGSHVVGYNAKAIPAILNRIEMMNLPFDVGPLQQDAMLNRDQTFIVTPNIAIQDNLESDINSSRIDSKETSSPSNPYGWRIEDYLD